MPRRGDLGQVSIRCRRPRRTCPWPALPPPDADCAGQTRRDSAYDANGNWTQETGSQAFTTSISATSNQLNSTTGQDAQIYTYDAAGNTTSFAGATYTYNQRGRISVMSASSGSTNYYYDALGEPIEKTGVGVGIYVYDESGHLVSEYDTSGNLIEETIWMADTPVAVIQPSGSGVVFYYVHSDHLDTPRKITRPSDNALMWRWDPDVYGYPSPNGNPSGIGAFTYNLRFAGQVYMNESALYANYFRTYNPQSGRYLESDPIGLNGGSYSTYSYTNNNPLSNVDPAGLQAVPLPVPAPIIVPPVAVPGTPENKAFVDAAMGAIEEIQAAARKAARAVENACSSKTKEQNCRALYDTLIRSCWSITDPRKRQRCFEAAKSSYEECMSQD